MKPLRLELFNGSVLTAVWPRLDEDGDTESKPFFYVRQKGFNFRVTNPGTYREHYFEIGIIPSLSPVNRREYVRNPDYVAQNMQSRRASQHFRNHVLEVSKRGEFEEYHEFVCGNLPEVTNLEIATTPSDQPGEMDLDLYYTELGERIPKEVCWAGDGVQIYLQILTHLWRLRACAVVVLDEPDVFLHADLQRRLVRVLEGLHGQSIVATHSPEMLAEASSESIVWVDKSRSTALRRPNAASLEDLSSQIGSQFNLRLASALRARVVFFVEGEDMKMVRVVARKLGLRRTAEDLGITTISLGGFSHWPGVEPFKWLVDKFLDNSVRVAVVLDRDYRTDDQLNEIELSFQQIGVSGHVWRRKELENYFMDETLLRRCVPAIPSDRLGAMLLDVSQDVLKAVRGQFVDSQLKTRGRNVDATIISKVMNEVEESGGDLSWCLDRLPAKQLLAGLNRRIQVGGGKSISFAQLTSEIMVEEIPEEFVGVLAGVENLYLDRRA